MDSRTKEKIKLHKQIKCEKLLKRIKAGWHEGKLFKCYSFLSLMWHWTTIVSTTEICSNSPGLFCWLGKRVSKQNKNCSSPWT